jgi:hypothetical protein
MGIRDTHPTAPSPTYPAPPAQPTSGSSLKTTTVNVNVSGVPELLNKTLSQVRQEVAEAIRTIAASEPDQRIVARLHEVGAMVAQHLSASEAREAVIHAPVTQHKYPSGAERDVKKAVAIHGQTKAREETQR